MLTCESCHTSSSIASYVRMYVLTRKQGLQSRHKFVILYVHTLPIKAPSCHLSVCIARLFSWYTKILQDMQHFNKYGRVYKWGIIYHKRWCGNANPAFCDMYIRIRIYCIWKLCTVHTVCMYNKNFACTSPYVTIT